LGKCRIRVSLRLATEAFEVKVVPTERIEMTSQKRGGKSQVRFLDPLSFTSQLLDDGADLQRVPAVSWQEWDEVGERKSVVHQYKHGQIASHRPVDVSPLRSTILSGFADST